MKDNKNSVYLKKALEVSNLTARKNQPSYYENKETGREVKISKCGHYIQEDGKGGNIPVGRKTSL